jgi:hypothetical protein
LWQLADVVIRNQFGIRVSNHCRAAAEAPCACAEQSWRIVQPVLDAWAEKAEFPNYDSGSDGPNAADELLARDGGRVWRPVAPLSEQKT